MWVSFALSALNCSFTNIMLVNKLNTLYDTVIVYDALLLQFLLSLWIISVKSNPSRFIITCFSGYYKPHGDDRDWQPARDWCQPPGDEFEISPDCFLPSCTHDLCRYIEPDVSCCLFETDQFHFQPTRFQPRPFSEGEFDLETFCRLNFPERVRFNSITVYTSIDFFLLGSYFWTG